MVFLDRVVCDEKLSEENINNLIEKLGDEKYKEVWGGKVNTILFVLYAAVWEGKLNEKNINNLML